jgi:Fungal specific transcription factor domain
MLGVAIRIAQRMGIHSESALAKYTALEAELCRRLWWSLILFDTRISEMADHKTATLAPTWDCRIPLNVNDSDLQPEMKEPPAAQGKSTDAMFAVVRSELGEFVRHMMFHLDFTNPSLKPIFKSVQYGPLLEVAELATLEKMIEDKYLKFCDPKNPLHFMTIWWTRAYLAKCRLLEHYSRYSSSSGHQTDTQRDIAINYALRMLECDTKFRSSTLTKRFLWLIHLHFPFPAYLQIAQDLRRRPGSEQAKQAWEVMSDNFEARFIFLDKDSESPFFKIFTKIVLQAWEAREAAFSRPGEPLMEPIIVSSIRHRVAQIAQNAHIADTKQPNGVPGMEIDSFPMSLPMGSGSLGLPYSMGEQGGYSGIGSGVYSNMPDQPPLDVDANHIDWAAMDWGFGGVYPGVWDAEL